MLTDDVAVLRRIPMFAEVDVPKLKLLGLASRHISYAAGDLMLRQGEDARLLCIVLTGEVEVRRETAGGPVPITRLGAGAILGELGVVLDQPYSASVVAVSETTALEMDKAIFLDLLRQVPQLSMALIRELARRVVRTSDLYAEALRGH